jgi:amino acid permease
MYSIIFNYLIFFLSGIEAKNIFYLVISFAIFIILFWLYSFYKKICTILDSNELKSLKQCVDRVKTKINHQGSNRALKKFENKYIKNSHNLLNFK